MQILKFDLSRQVTRKLQQILYKKFFRLFVSLFRLFFCLNANVTFRPDLYIFLF